jgi:phospholipid/cholesterol/gamma-HCH transport system permease protein
MEIRFQNYQNQKVTVCIAGRVSFDTVESIIREIHSGLERLVLQELTVDLAGTEYFDSAGVAMLFKLRGELTAKNIELNITNASEQIANLLRLFDYEKPAPLVAEPQLKKRNFLQMMGEWAFDFSRDLRQLNIYIGRVAISLLYIVLHPRRIKWGEVMFLLQRSGAEAVPILALLSFLIGLVSAFSAALQLRQFGANIYIADLVGIGMTQEMGALLTAIILTGRSGSAFAAEIGTMKISDEIDALTVMGIKPLNYLVLPRIIAVMLAMPILTLFADFCGIMGGMVISMTSLDLTPNAFLGELKVAITLFDVFYGAFKGFVFGILVAGVGCYRGLRTEGGALGVGRSTTSSVVSGIFLIIVADSVFAILYNYLSY